MIALAVLELFEHGNSGSAPMDAGLRIEVNRKERGNGQTTYYGAWRRRGAKREYVGYISWQALTQAHGERIKAYKPRKLNIDVAADLP